MGVRRIRDRNCVWKEWRDNIGLVDACVYYSTMYGLGYDGKPFLCCPWCGKALMGNDGVAIKDRVPISEMKGLL